MTSAKGYLSRAIYELSDNALNDEIYHFMEEMYHGRPYHNLDHVSYCLNELRHVHMESMDFEDRMRLIVAICFHDLMQDFMRPADAVSNSAEIMEESLIDVLSTSDIRIIKNLILSTGAKICRTDLEHYMHDIDYSIMGNNSWNEYHAYVKAVEKEALQDGIHPKYFKTGRIDFLQLLLLQTTIYSTEIFGNKYEWQARKNIAREIAERQKGELE
ncbi:MAG: hypothetical protein KKD44_27125 [Proteobacteria bacterium]|nr:hypothetical protein [Pseudomonadota bacterium]